MHFNQMFAALAACLLVSAAPTPSIVDYAVRIEKRSVPDFLASVDEFNELHRAAQLSAAAYAGCSKGAFDVTIVQQIDNATTDTQGYIGYSPSWKRITVALRGSTALIDFENDLDTTLVTPTLSGVKFPIGAQVMHGIQSPWSSVHDLVISTVKSLIVQYPDYTVEATGHSLGGSLTYLAHIALAQNFPEKSVISNAMAAFAIGNAEFAAFGDSQKGHLRRGNNLGDGVPNDNPQFTHYGVEFYGSGTAASTVKCTGELDRTCSAGNNATGITLGHLSSFGVNVIFDGFGGCKN
ncbi:A triacylglycerol lipase from penicillium expansum At 1.3 [Lophium mytilinum]|uniref:A triacylglycerol lipase from penicillium expansum At 1.3 n=1 Tax=Lophium mytilinum TaxID=390894 RepID=A0A6A6QQC8_9PEZI|nr:A triacylglycerol lipase from penicillium expansum At 1.3 [Lophium mytilinum]